MQVEIVEFATTKVAVVEHCGAPERVYESAAKLIAWRKETGLSPVAKARTFGVPYSNPKTTPPDEFRWDVCGEVMAEIEPNRHGVINGVIPGGRCAMFTHKGSHSVMDDSICQLYDLWLPQSGEELRDYPCFFHYRNFIHEVDEFELLTDVYIPLK